MIALDTETTGVDFYHGTKPFFVSTCNEAGEQQYWEWDVDPLDRMPIVPDGDLVELSTLIESSSPIIFQNAKFDITALATLHPSFGTDWNWGNTFDTLLAAHLLGSNQPKDLTSLSVQYLGVDPQSYEDALEEAVKEARGIARRDYPDWRIAKEDLPEMPSAGKEVWRADYWLPRALARELNEPDDHPWYTVLQEYSNSDTAVTLALWKVMEAELKKRSLWDIFEARREVLPIAYQMESRGVSLNSNRLETLIEEYQHQSELSGRLCHSIARSYTAPCQTCGGLGSITPVTKSKTPRPTVTCPDCEGACEGPYKLTLPKNGINNSLRTFAFDVLKLDPIYNKKAKKDKKTGRKTVSEAATLDKVAMDQYLSILPERSKAHTFIRNLKAKRKRDTAISYMESYKRFWLPGDPLDPETYWLHPSLNPTATATLRWSSSAPNEQNISKQEGFNLRFTFGFGKGREGYSLDAKNVELRIPAYEAKEEEMVALFERPDDPPYFGSNHLLIAHILWPKEFDECLRNGEQFKKKYASSLYQWTKNGNFAVQYGAIDKANGEGTADRAYHQAGAQAKIKARFKKLTALNEHYIWFANKYGYVETLPDRTVDPKRGYPLMTTRTEWGRISPTIPLNYHVQGTAMWITMRAMIKVYNFLTDLNNGVKFLGKVWTGGYYIMLQVHDELVLDCPSGEGKGKNPWDYNRPVLDHVLKLMSECGDDVGIPVPFGLEYHSSNWSEGLVLV